MLRITVQTPNRAIENQTGLEIDIRVPPLVMFLAWFHLLVSGDMSSDWDRADLTLRADVPQSQAAGVSQSTHDSRRPTVVLGAGEQAEVSDDGRRIIIHTKPSGPKELQRPLQWKEGRLVFNGQPLATVVTELNRYNPGQLVITDEAIAGIKVVGPFCPTKVEDFLKFLRMQYGITAKTLSFTEGHPQIIALTRAPQPRNSKKLPPG
jgi:ferric-dicitrate binding protein FerR (iron transport regulator)